MNERYSACTSGTACTPHRGNVQRPMHSDSPRRMHVAEFTSGHVVAPRFTQCFPMQMCASGTSGAVPSYSGGSFKVSIERPRESRASRTGKGRRNPQTSFQRLATRNTSLLTEFRDARIHPGHENPFSAPSATEFATSIARRLHNQV